MTRFPLLGRSATPAAPVDSGAHLDLKGTTGFLTVAAIDDRTQVIGLRVDRDAIRAFL